MKNLYRTAAAAGLFAATFMIGNVISAGPASAYACKDGHRYLVGAGVHATQAGAVAMAKNNWKNKVTAQFGLTWSVWEISEGQHVQCAANGGGGQSCVVRSRPCQHVAK